MLRSPFTGAPPLSGRCTNARTLPTLAAEQNRRHRTVGARLAHCKERLGIAVWLGAVCAAVNLGKAFAKFTFTIGAQLFAGRIDFGHFARHPISVKHAQLVGEGAKGSRLHVVGTGPEHVGFLDVVQVG